MSDKIIGKGSCLCGAAKFSTDTLDPKSSACHCSTCRNWGGGPMLVVDCGTDVAFESLDSVNVFDSSEWAERGFCTACGTHLFYRLKESKQHFVPVGLFEDESEFVFDHQVFIEEKPEHYSFANKTHEMTGAELFAQFGATLD